jgi:hypothetical protein
MNIKEQYEKEIGDTNDYEATLRVLRQYDEGEDLCSYDLSLFEVFVEDQLSRSKVKDDSRNGDMNDIKPNVHVSEDTPPKNVRWKVEYNCEKK